MKSRIFKYLLILLLATPLMAQVDRSKQPEPGPAPEIKIGDFEEFQLDNGLKVFVVENENLPGITVRMVIDRDPILESEHAGYVQTAGELLRTGTTTRTKDQLDEEIDFIGASLSTSSTSVFGSALKKHKEKLFELFADVVLNANFTQEELDKIKKQTLSGLATQKDDPSSMAANVRRVLDYGMDHPYGEITTEETVKTITLDMCKDYYKTYFHPNIAYLAIVGDISKGDAEDLVNKYFGKWEKAEVPTFTYKTPKAPLVRKVAVVDRPASVQSVINITYPIELLKGSPDVIATTVANQILGGSATARLFMNLREDKAFTYGAYSSIASDELVGNFRASCEARTIVTDSAITEFIYEMKKMRTDKVADEELQSVKNYLNGSFARSLENPQTVAQFALNTAIYKLPKDYYKNYLKNLEAVSADDVLAAAKKYINPKKAYVLVVGNTAEFADKLKQFSISGKIDYYDMYGKEYDPNVSAVPEGLTAQTIFDNYIEAIGGKEKYLSVKDQKMTMKGNVQGMDITLEIDQKAPNKYYQKLGIPGMFEQVTVFDGEKGYAGGMGQKQMLEGKTLATTKVQSNMYLYADYKKAGVEASVEGMEKLSGKDVYKVVVSIPEGSSYTQYFDVTTGYLVRQITPIETPQGQFTSTVDFEEYQETDGMMFPTKITQTSGPQTVVMSLESVEINKGIDDSLFKVD